MANLTPGESHYVLHSLLSSGALRASQVEKALRGRADEIRNLRERLASLESLFSSGGSASKPGGRRRRGPGRPPGRPAAKSAAARPRRRMSAKTRALRKLQGRYMGLVRGLKVAEKARVRATREKQGMAAAIRLASSLGAKKS